MQNLQRIWINSEGRQHCSHVQTQKHWKLCWFRRGKIYNSNPSNCISACFISALPFLFLWEVKPAAAVCSRKLLWWSLGKENTQEPKKTQHREKTKEEDKKTKPQTENTCAVHWFVFECLHSAAQCDENTHTHTHTELVYSGESAICAIFSCSEIFVFPVTAEGGGRIYLHIHIWASRLPNCRPPPPPAAARRAWKSALISRAGCWGTAR